MAKTPAQQVADLTAKLARAKKMERAKRTRTLIELGAMFEHSFSYLEGLTAEQKAEVKKKSITALTHYVQKLVLEIKTAEAKPQGAEK